MKRIAELRKSKNLNQTGLAMQLNVSQKMISAYENGTHQPSIETLKRMSEIFNVSVDYIIENTDIKTPADYFLNKNQNEIDLLNIFKELSNASQQKAIGVLLAVRELL